MPRTVCLVYETEAACRNRLSALGYGEETAVEIASYVAQASDIEPLLDDLKQAFAARGLALVPVPVDRLIAVSTVLKPDLIWPLTDGMGCYRGSFAAAFACFTNTPVIGGDPTLYMLAQDKFRSGAVMTAAGLPVPPAGLMRGGVTRVDAPGSGNFGYFVKPNRLGAKVGVRADARAVDLAAAAVVAERIFDIYRDDALVQTYVPGRNVRVSYLEVAPKAGAERLGLSIVETEADFQTAAESMALYGTTRTDVATPVLTDLRAVAPDAAAGIAEALWAGAEALGLSGVFSFDLRFDEDGSFSVLEFEVSPGLPCFDFVSYVEQVWGQSLAEAMANAAAVALGR